VPVASPDEASTLDAAVDTLRRQAAPGRVARERDGITFLVSPGWLTSGDLHAFFNEWPRRPSDDAIDALIRGSYVVVIAMMRDEIVGFANAISDGRMFAYIPFVEVHPERRHLGIGTQLMDVLLGELRHMHGVDLTCDPELVPFYERVGLEPLVSMIRRNNDVL
jgi:ribosomal protein S18 acetylase RimI-like enzyme